MRNSLKTLKAQMASIALASGVALAAPAAFAQSTPTGLYVGVGAGLNMPTDSTERLQTTNGGTSAVPTSFNTGYNIVGAVGYKWNPALRTELEFDYRRASLDQFNGPTANGSQHIYSFSANVLYDINLNAPIVPYVGGGLGIAHNHWSNVNGGFNSENFTDSDANLQWQLIAGVSTPLGPTTSLFVDYRYIGIDNSKFTGSLGDTLADHYDHSHNVLAGVRFFL